MSGRNVVSWGLLLGVNGRIESQRETIYICMTYGRQSRQHRREFMNKQSYLRYQMSPENVQFIWEPLVLKIIATTMYYFFHNMNIYKDKSV